jgi:hypothetical protein
LISVERRTKGQTPLICPPLSPLEIIPHLGGTIASLNALAGLILTTVLAGILISLPVAGFRPIRAFLLTRTDLPIPGSTKAPFFLVSAIANAAYSSIMDAANAATRRLARLPYGTVVRKLSASGYPSHLPQATWANYRTPTVGL